MGCQKKAAGAARGIANGLHRFRPHHFHYRLNQGTGRKVLPRTAFDIFSVFLQQSFVDIPLHINIQPAPCFIVDQLNDSLEFGGILNPVLGFSEDHT